jgi:Uma2 family endonuclease
MPWSTSNRVVHTFKRLSAVSGGYAETVGETPSMGVLMSDAPIASASKWPLPPEGGWTADDLDRIPDLPQHTELIDGSLVFVRPQTWFHLWAMRFFESQFVALAPKKFAVAREFTIDVDRQNRPEPDIAVVRMDAVSGPDGTRVRPRLSSLRLRWSRPTPSPGIVKPSR